MNQEEGFTLLEIIISLVLVGLMVSLVGILMVAGVQEYVFSKENIVSAQKASIALRRLEKEMVGITDIDADNSDGACVRYKLESVSPYFRAIGVRGDVIELKTAVDADCDCATNGDVLLDKTTGFSLSYEDGSVTPPMASAAPPADIRYLDEVRMQFTLDLPHAGAEQKTFDLRVNPRNNGNLNGPGVQP